LPLPVAGGRVGDSMLPAARTTNAPGVTPAASTHGAWETGLGRETASAKARNVVTPPPSGIPSRAIPRPSESSATRRAVVQPLSTDRYQIRFTVNAATREKLQLAQDLLRHAIPNGDPAAIFDRALTALLEKLAKDKLAETSRPRPSREPLPDSRHVPATVKRAVWLRDAGRCAFVAKSGRRCAERGFLEFHHVRPYANGGEATTRNVELRCRPHSGYEADLFFGPSRVDGREPTRSGTTSTARAGRATSGGLRSRIATGAGVTGPP
jgi:hypothetical protein